MWIRVSHAAIRRELEKMEKDRAAKARRRYPYHGWTKAELLAEHERITQDPANKNVNGGLALYTPRAMRRLEMIAQAIGSMAT